MFASLLVPYLPADHNVAVAPPALVQVVAKGVNQAGMIFDGGCQTVQTPDNPKEWEIKVLRPADVLGMYYGNHEIAAPDLTKAGVTIAQGAKHGALVPLSAQDLAKLGVGSESGPAYGYKPNPGYLGADDVTFLVSLNGTSHKVRQRLHVVKQVNDNDWYGPKTPATICAASHFKRVA